MDLHILFNIFMLFGLTVFIIYLCNFLKIPHLIGYLITGVILSPKTSSLLRDSHEVEVYAEIGVILLLFTVGLEFSFSKLKRIQRYVLIGGLLQVLLTIGITAILLLLMNRGWAESVFWGFVTSLSSTAIVIKILQDRVKINSDYGRIILAMLLFQDIIIVPFMLFTPILAGNTENAMLEVLYLVGKLALIGLVAYVLARWVIPQFLYQVMKIQSQEVFLIATIFIVAGITLMTSSLGLSLSLGAFIAGLIIAETDYNRLAISCILPFRYVFISFFFISMGMLLDYTVFLAQWDLILFWLVFILLVKVAAGFLATLALKEHRKTALMVGLGIAQIGEFSFILSKIGLDNGLITSTNYQIFLAVSILTMAITPFIVNNMETLAERFSKFGAQLWPAKT